MRSKLVYWSLNRVNGEKSQLEGREEERRGHEKGREPKRRIRQGEGTKRINVRQGQKKELKRGKNVDKK